MSKKSTDFEKLVAKIQAKLAPQGKVEHDVRLLGRESETPRQIDVLLRQQVGQYEILIALECKDHSRRIDVPAVEAFIQKMKDVGAHRGAIVSAKGFTDPAKTLAKKAFVEVYTPFDTDDHQWKIHASAPVICDFRSAKISILIEIQHAAYFELPSDFYVKTMVYDHLGNELGVPIRAAADRWDQGYFPIDPGTYERQEIFGSEVFISDGVGGRMPVRLFAGLSVGRRLFFGRVPLEKVSGFRDEVSGRIVTNAFETGFVNATEVEEDWLQIESIEDAPVRPLLTFTGLSVWGEGPIRPATFGSEDQPSVDVES